MADRLVESRPLGGTGQEQDGLGTSAEQRPGELKKDSVS